MVLGFLPRQCDFKNLLHLANTNILQQLLFLNLFPHIIITQAYCLSHPFFLDIYHDVGGGMKLLSVSSSRKTYSCMIILAMEKSMISNGGNGLYSKTDFLKILQMNLNHF
jgi:hypothetical protein